MFVKFYRKRILKNKNNKFFYYCRSVFKELIPSHILRRKFDFAELNAVSSRDFDIQSRIDYYNKLENEPNILTLALSIRDYKMPRRLKVYYFDSIYYLKHFEKNLKFHLLPGDITIVPDEATIVKSRPIDERNGNAVILNLDKCRHFNFLQDYVSFRDKKSLLIGRSGFSQPHRARFYEMYNNSEFCNLKKVVKKIDKDYLDIEGHLQFKFILALEGNDVATNLKWIMSSNSIAVMSKPKFETWYMEGTLLPDYHYICIKDDYSDLEEKLNYYIQHVEEAEKIISNAHRFVAQFMDQRKEDIISLLVLRKYFERTHQI